MVNTTQIAVVGAGAWGTALSRLLCNKDIPVALWDPFVENIERLAETGEHPHLPGAKLPKKWRLCRSAEEALDASGVVLLAVASHGVRPVCDAIEPLIRSDTIIVSCAKGLEDGTRMRMSEVIGDVLGRRFRLAALSGPSHAEEVALDLPTAVTVSSTDETVAQQAQDLLMTPRFRVYTSADLIGVELGGALKNVIAIAAGVVNGLGFGDNTKAGLITRGLAEITRLAVAMGARPETLAGLSGLGDLVVTCTSKLSRNWRFGNLIGRGGTSDDALAEINQTVEGIKTTWSAYELSRSFDVEMPITSDMHAVLFEGKLPGQAVRDLMGRERKAEVWG